MATDDYDWEAIASQVMQLVSNLAQAVSDNFDECPTDVQEAYDDLKSYLGEHRVED